MIVGFNHNVSYGGVGFHVQTEDSGPKKPQLVTLLYHGGTIIASQKTLYDDIIRVDNLEQVVEDLAKEQHKGMLKKLTRGEFDKRITELGISLQTAPADQPSSSAVVEPVAASAPAAKIVEEPVIDKFSESRRRTTPTLDDLIYAYLTAGQDKA